MRYRPSIKVSDTGNDVGVADASVTLDAAKGVEVYASAVDRRFFGGLRLGVDVSRTFGIGGVAYARNTAFATRLFGSRELADGKAEIEAEVGLATSKDQGSTMACAPTSFGACYGRASTSTKSLGGSLYYRLAPAWLAIGSVYVAVEKLSTLDAANAVVKDPSLVSTTGFARVSYRF